MKVITRQSKVADALKSFFVNYEQYRGKGPFYTRERYNAVVALGNNPTADDVAKTLYDSWVSCNCSECQKSVDMIVQVGHEPDYDSLTAYLCKECAYKAFDLLAKEECK